MPFEKITVDDLMKDQERLKEELEKLENDFVKKKKEKPIIKPPEQIKTRVIGSDPDALMKQQLEESKRIMEKFDYLIDTLLSTTDEGSEELEKTVMTLAQTQEHALAVLTNLKELVQKTEEEMPSKEEMRAFEEEQNGRYKELNDKMNMLMEKVERPSYLKELDAIRVGVSNILMELKKLEEEEERGNAVRQKAQELNQKVDEVEKHVKEAPDLAEAPEFGHAVGEISTQVDELEKSLKDFAKTKKTSQ